MHELKCRAWHKAEKKMCEVSVITLDKGAFLLGAEIGPDIELSDGTIAEAPPEGRFCPWDDIILMLYTGLSDKNGKEIYEGDIIEYQSGIKPQRTIIEFEIHCYNAGFYPQGGANASHYWEVIGNIREHPELLENPCQ